MSEEFKPTLVIDATGGVIGRIASYAAKQSLLGKVIAIVHCERAVVSGNKHMVVEEYKIARARGGTSLKGPNFPKDPARLMKRTIRGMLSYKQGRGAAAFDRIRCYSGLPSEFSSMKAVSVTREMQTKTMTVGELTRIM